uniref:Uncharacterized protein n=1 Tax=Oryza meridionalis TaxID=40149 RepID=A0A0E0D2K7_9ORYZ
MARLRKCQKKIAGAAAAAAAFLTWPEPRRASSSSPLPPRAVVCCCRFSCDSSPIGRHAGELCVAGQLPAVWGPKPAEAAPRGNAFPSAGNGLASSQHEVQVSGGGVAHEVAVVCRGEECGSRDGEVVVSIDGEKVVEARRVKWNFHGNRTVVLGDAV